LCLAAFLAAQAFAEDADLFANIKINDHIRITPKTGTPVSGIVKAINKEKITLDVSYDEPDFDGNISVYKNNIRKIEDLGSLTDAEKEQVETEKKERLEKTWRESEPAAPPKELAAKESVTPASQEESDKEKEREKLMVILKKFNPDDGWNTEKKADILKKIEVLRGADEREFLKIYDDWLKALELKAMLDRRTLVEKFPPDKWNKQRYDEITSRFTRMHVGPSREEQEFVDKYKEWEKGVEENKIEEEEAKKKEEEEESEKKTETTPALQEESRKQ
jgi:hypothetical protein